MKTIVCDILDIQYPIIQGGMEWISGPELVSAVSEAGCLGLLAGGSMNPQELRDAIRKVRESTEKPFGVNLPIMYPVTSHNVEVVIEERVPVAVTSAGNPSLYTEKLKKEGIKVLHVVPSVKFARKAESAGVDIVIAEGWEAGGHNGVDEITTMVLIPQVVDAVQIPVIAAGGIADARAVIAAFSLGAKGVQMGTRFLASLESMAHPSFKERIVQAGDNATVVTGRRFSPVRTLRNRFTDWVLEMEYSGLPKEEILKRIGEGRAMRGAKGDLEEGSLQCGAVAGLIKDLKPARQIIEDIVLGVEKVFSEVEEIIRN